MAKIFGIGGVFYKAADPDAVRAWYARVLGFDLTDWGSAMFTDAARGFQQWSLFPEDSDYLAPSEQPFMINLMVDDLDGMAARIEREGEKLLGRQDGEYGKFAWLMDPAGVKLELWQPPAE